MYGLGLGAKICGRIIIGDQCAIEANFRIKAMYMQENRLQSVFRKKGRKGWKSDYESI